MLNALANTKFDTNDVLSMLEGHHKFIQKNTGKTIDGEVQKYLVNPEGIFSNNRHFIKKGGQMGMPNGDAPTESQSLCILGYALSYIATQKKEYLDAAEKYFDAYVKYFYAGQPIPDTPSLTQPWISNWLVNGKEKVLANYPLSDDGIITHGGFRDTEFTFAAGNAAGGNGQLQTRIPHGSPNWGEYLDRATFAYVGGLGWKSIVATVYGLKADGVTIDWSDASKKRGKQYDVDWIVDHYGRRVSYDNGWLDDPTNDAAFIAKNPGYTNTGQLYPNDIGLITLKKQYKNLQTGHMENIPAGTYKTCYATKNPVAQGGFELQPNTPWHNRPLNVPAGYNPVTGKYDLYAQLGNSSDSEQWFADAAYILWKITDGDKYRKAWQAVIFNTYAYSDIDAHDKFFRVDPTSDNPWTDGIAYDYNYYDEDLYPNGLPDPVLSRDKNTGYIEAKCAAGMINHTMEQQAVWYRVNGDSIISTEAGGTTDTGGAVGLTVDVKLTNSKQESTDNADKYRYSIQPSIGSAMPHDVPLKKFSRTVHDDGTPYALVGNHVSTWTGDATNPIAPEHQAKSTIDWASGIIDSDRDGSFTSVNWPTQMDPNYRTGASIGLTWSWEKVKDPTTGDMVNQKIPIKSMVYRSNVPFATTTFYDKDGWGWYFNIPATGTDKDITKCAWSTFTFDPALAIFNRTQVKHPHPAWFREIRSDRDLGASGHDHSWYIPNKYPAERQYFDGQRTTAPQYQLPNGDWHQMGNDDWRDPRWLDIQNVFVMPWTQAGSDPWRNSIDPTYYNMDRPDQFIIKNYYGNIVYSNHTPPAKASSGPMDEQFDITFQGSPDTSPTSNGVTQIYCVNELPPLYNPSDTRYLMLYSLTAESDQNVPTAWTWEIGDCFVKNYLPGNLKYTPGVIPFSNIYSEAGASTFDGWHGMPYPGYQYPFIYIEDKPGYEERLNNMVDFMFDSQEFYASRYGIMGPGASAFIWNRWDNYKYVYPEHGDKVDGFTMYHWGTDNAWSGYQARAYAGAARCLYELKLNKRPVPPKLVTYVDRWSEYLYGFMTDAIRTNGRPISPTDWSVTGDGNAGGIAKPLPGDFTPHMCGLFLAGACYAGLAGTTYEMQDALVELLASEMGWKDYSRLSNSHYQNTGIAGHVMNGGFVPPWGMDTSDKHDETNNSTSYGFHSGEVMRGLSMYLLYKQLKGAKDVNMYRLVNSNI